MKKKEQPANITEFGRILKKYKSIKNDTLYTYRDLGKPSDKLRVYISRLADRGLIVKAGRGQFYKPKQMTAVKRAAKSTTLNKKLFSNDLFWNVRDGFNINTDTLIKAYLKNYTENDLMGLYSLFGYTRLIEESLKLYGNRRNPHYQEIRKIFERFEKWRLTK